MLYERPVSIKGIDGETKIKYLIGGPKSLQRTRSQIELLAEEEIITEGERKRHLRILERAQKAIDEQPKSLVHTKYGVQLRDLDKESGEAV